MFYTMNYDIQIGNFKVNNLLKCVVRKSVNQIADTAEIHLPGMAYGAALEVESKIKRGDEVIIRFGYDDELPQEFSGFITSISTDNTIVISCEDAIFQTRKEVKNKQYKNQSAGDIIKDVIGQLEGFTVVVGEGVENVRFSKYTVRDATAYEILKKIQQDTRLHIFCKGKELHVHLQFDYRSGEAIFDLSRNVERANLKYIKKEDKKVLVEVKGIDRSHKETIVKVGESGGDKFTEYRYNITDKTALKTIGEEMLKRYWFTGYEGSLVGWLLPFVTYGHTAEIRDELYPERSGKYYVEASTVTFSKSGGKRESFLSIKVA